MGSPADMGLVPYWWCPLSLILGVVVGVFIGYVRGHEEGLVAGWFQAIDQFKHWRARSRG